MQKNLLWINLILPFLFIICP